MMKVSLWIGALGLFVAGWFAPTWADMVGIEGAALMLASFAYAVTRTPSHHTIGNGPYRAPEITDARLNWCGRKYSDGNPTLEFLVRAQHSSHVQHAVNAPSGSSIVTLARNRMYRVEIPLYSLNPAAIGETYKRQVRGSARDWLEVNGFNGSLPEIEERDD